MAFTVDHRHGQLRLNANVAFRAYLPQKRPGVAVTAEEHMLTVVDDLSGLAIGKRRGPAAEASSSLEDQHAGAVAREPNRRAEPGKASTNHNRVVSRHVGSSHCLRAMSACAGFATRVRCENTSKPLRSIFMSVSK